MPTIHRALGFLFVIFCNDHEPAHVHVRGKGGHARVQIVGAGAPFFTRMDGLTKSDTRRILHEIHLNLGLFHRKLEKRHD